MLGDIGVIDVHSPATVACPFSRRCLQPEGRDSSNHQLMKLATLLTPQQVILDLKAEVCDEAIEVILDHLIVKDVLPKSMREEVCDALREREQQISTGIGCGVAIPHAFSDSIEHVIACFARAKEGVDFEAIDHAPVNYIILFVVPKKDYNMHLQTLAAIAKMFNNCEVRQQLSDAETVEEVLDIFASRPSRTHAEQQNG